MSDNGCGNTMATDFFEIQALLIGIFFARSSTGIIEASSLPSLWEKHWEAGVTATPPRVLIEPFRWSFPMQCNTFEQKEEKNATAKKSDDAGCLLGSASKCGAPARELGARRRRRPLWLSTCAPSATKKGTAKNDKNPQQACKWKMQLNSQP